MKKVCNCSVVNIPEKREAELNNIDGRKRKCNNSAKLREQYDDFGTEDGHEKVIEIIEKSKTKKKCIG
jgi:hypothetical protein